jgi:hypothetical protein
MVKKGLLNHSKFFDFRLPLTPILKRQKEEGLFKKAVQSCPL